MSYATDAVRLADEYEKKRTASAKTYADTVNAAADRQRDQYTAQVNAQIAALPAQFQEAYDASAVQELIDRRNIAETMANWGLTDSGLTRSQLSAGAIAHANRSAAITAQKNAARQKLEEEIDAYWAKNDSAKQKTTADALLSAQSDSEKTRASLWENAASAQSRLDSAERTAAAADRKTAAEERIAAQKLAAEKEEAAAARAAAAQSAAQKNAVAAQSAAQNHQYQLEEQAARQQNDALNTACRSSCTTAGFYQEHGMPATACQYLDNFGKAYGLSSAEVLKLAAQAGVYAQYIEYVTKGTVGGRKANQETYVKTKAEKKAEEEEAQQAAKAAAKGGN